MSISIKRIISTDYIVSIKKLIGSISEFSKNDKKQFYEDIDGYFDWLQDTYMYGAFDNEELCGIVISEKDIPKHVLNINVLAVSDKYRNKGIATSLIKRTLSLNYKLFVIETESSEDYLKARNFYTKVGFKQEGCIKSFWSENSDKLILTYRK